MSLIIYIWSSGDITMCVREDLMKNSFLLFYNKRNNYFIVFFRLLYYPILTQAHYQNNNVCIFSLKKIDPTYQSFKILSTFPNAPCPTTDKGQIIKAGKNIYSDTV